uniref:Uncharacterized protein n=1 Tax=Setaria italica TaxID=4555 RepID=K3Y0H8_SETIT
MTLVQRAVPRTKWRRAGVGGWVLDWGCGEVLEFLTIRNFCLKSQLFRKGKHANMLVDLRKKIEKVELRRSTILLTSISLI